MRRESDIMRVISDTLADWKFKLGALLIFGFTASCTILLFMRIAPPNAPWLPFAGVGALEYGLWNWSDYHKNKAKNGPQLTISLIMAIGSGLAVAATTVLELALNLLNIGITILPAWVMASALWVPIAAIGANVLAYLAIGMYDPAHVKKMQALDTLSYGPPQGLPPAPQGPGYGYGYGPAYPPYAQVQQWQAPQAQLGGYNTYGLPPAPPAYNYGPVQAAGEANSGPFAQPLPAQAQPQEQEQNAQAQGLNLGQAVQALLGKKKAQEAPQEQGEAQG